MILLVRDTEFIPDGTFGHLVIGDISFCTMEDDRLRNAPTVSCILPGVYTLKRSFFNKGGYEVFEICNVPNRSKILIHIANTEENVEGCVGLGTEFGSINVHDEDDPQHNLVSKKAVINSKIAFNSFMGLMQGINSTQLVVIDPMWK